MFFYLEMIQKIILMPELVTKYLKYQVSFFMTFEKD